MGVNFNENKGGNLFDFSGVNLFENSGGKLCEFFQHFKPS